MLTLLLAGCGTGAELRSSATGSTLPRDYQPLRAGRGARFRLSPTSAAVARRRAVGSLGCGHPQGRRYAVHLELYAHGLVLPVPAGIGFAPPLRREGPYVRAGGCAYDIRTVEPTGLVLISPPAFPRREVTPPRLGLLFRVWGQALGRRRLASFSGAVRAYVDGRRWAGPLRQIPLRRHAEIVLEVGEAVPAHPSYRFPPGL